MINVKEQFGRWFPKFDDNSHFEASVILKEIEEVTPPEEKQAKVIAMFKGNKPTDCMTVLQTEHDKYTELMMQISPARKSLDTFTDEERKMYTSLYGEDKLDLMYYFPGDIFMNDTIPVEDIMLIKCYNSPNKIINFARIKILPEAERKSNIQKMLDGETKYAEVGWFKLTFKDVHDITFYMSIGIMECAEGIDLSDVEGMIMQPFYVNKDFLDRMPNLKWVQITGAGYDRVDIEEVKKRGLVLTNTRGVMSISIAEDIFSKMLFLSRKMRTIEADKKAHVWEMFGQDQWMCTCYADLYGKTIGIMGGMGPAATVDLMSRIISVQMTTFGTARTISQIRIRKRSVLPP